MASRQPDLGFDRPPHIRLNSSQSNLLNSESQIRDFASPQVPNHGHLRPISPDGRPFTSNSHTYATGPERRTFSPTSHGSHHSSPTDPSDTLLLPPPYPSSRTRRYRDDDSTPGTPSESLSRRNSFSSSRIRPGGSRSSSGDPFADSRAPSRSGSDEEHLNTQTVSDKYAILPSAGLLLFPEDIEKDDWLHNPDPNEKDHRECNLFTKRGFVNVGGLFFVTAGLLVLFIGYPILTFVQKYQVSDDPCDTTPDCIDVGKVPLLKNIRTGLIDPDTPQSSMTKKAPDGTQLKLVFSDEFNKDGRTFYPGDDPYFEAVDLWYGVTQDLEWYDPDAVSTSNGVLELRFDGFPSHGLNYRSGMLQSWNKLCFTGGMLEASISLPGRGDTVGFWPGFWSMGNLGRPGYAATTDGMWPYSYHDQCDVGITANQSSSDGLSFLPGMKLPACTCSGEDHPSPGKSRSAPEIDVIEASNGPLGKSNNFIGTVSQSCQLAPFDIFYQPNVDFMEVYNDKITSINSYAGGPFQQALSGLTNLNNKWYDGKAYASYNFYYRPGASGSITWSVGDQSTWKLDGRAIGPNGNIGQRVIPQEPMSVIMNFGMSTGFSAINYTGITTTLPALMRFDYVRIYQPEGSTSVTCDPPGYETTAYIRNHMEAYTNPNKTLWSQTKNPWPKNSFVNGCK